jgi:hypothetical protein
MFHPSLVCSIRPFQQSSLICSRKNSAMPLFHPAQQDGGGVGAFEEDGLVGGEQGDAAGGEFFSSFSALKVSRAERLMSSQTTAANAGAGPPASASRLAMPPSRGMPMPSATTGCCWYARLTVINGTSRLRRCRRIPCRGLPARAARRTRHRPAAPAAPGHAVGAQAPGEDDAALRSGLGAMSRR